MRIVIDIDNTICSQEESYSNAKPYLKRISQVNEFYDKGYEITMFTARNGKLWKKLTEQQLKTWGVKYHNLFFDKPPAEIYIDDRAVGDSVLGEKW